MTPLSITINSAFESYYEMLRRRIHDLSGPLTTEQLWQRPYAYGNSVGHLLLHLIGNLNYYIGAQIANTSYVRNRDLEFTDLAQTPKEVVLADLDRAIDLVVETIRAQSAEDWSRPYAAERELESKDRFTILLRCAAHANHHIGQMVYLQKELI